MDPKTLISAVRAAVDSVDSNLLITDMKTQMEQIDRTFTRSGLSQSLSLFAVLALVVACVGFMDCCRIRSHGARRKLEFAGAGSTTWRCAASGSPARHRARRSRYADWGCCCARRDSLSAELSVWSEAVRPGDYRWVAFLLIAVALLASYIPARRAMKTIPWWSCGTSKHCGVMCTKNSVLLWPLWLIKKRTDTGGTEGTRAQRFTNSGHRGGVCGFRPATMECSVQSCDRC